MYGLCGHCSRWVDAELTHNGLATVGHLVCCGWGQTIHPKDLRNEIPGVSDSKEESNQ